VPPGEGWLGPVERGVLRALRTERRRSDWRLGRWTAKLAVGAWMSVAPEHVEIVAAADGAPEAWLDGRRVPASVSISHRAGRALAVVGGAGALVGCDLELVEPRSDAFVREWLGQAEWEILSARPEGERALAANLLWTAKEAAAKVRREGLRLDVRNAVVVGAPETALGGEWRALSVRWGDGSRPTSAWSRVVGAFVMSVAAEPAPASPRKLSWAGGVRGAH
jgi:4'-phosphopantetheinyl transferase